MSKITVVSAEQAMLGWEKATNKLVEYQDRVAQLELALADLTIKYHALQLQLSAIEQKRIDALPCHANCAGGKHHKACSFWNTKQVLGAAKKGRPKVVSGDTIIDLRKLVTVAEFELMTPYQQGFVIYMQAEQPGSPLKKRQKNPYTKQSKAWSDFNRGQVMGAMTTQDCEEG